MPAERQYLDANVFLAYVLNEGPAPIIEEVLREGRAGERKLITSTLTIAEVAFVAGESQGGSLHPEALSVIDSLWDTGSPVAMFEATMSVMYRARDLARSARSVSRQVKPGDAIHLATAREVGVDVIYTYEKQETRKFWQTLVDIPVTEPDVSQLPLI